MIPKSLFFCLAVFWSLFLCANVSVYIGCFKSWIAYPLFLSLIVTLIVALHCLFSFIWGSLKKTKRPGLNAFLLLLLLALSILAYGKWCFKPSENIMATVDSGMYFSAASSIARHGSYTMEAQWPDQAPESLKKWLLGQNASEAQRRNYPGPRYWNFIVGYFFLDQDARSGAVAIPFPNGYPTLLASALKVGGPTLAFCLNTIIHLAASALFGLLAFRCSKQRRAAFAALLMLFFPLSVWSANHLYAEGLLLLGWLSTILAWSCRAKIPRITGILTGAGPGLGLLIKIDALLGIFSLVLLISGFRKQPRFTLNALVTFLLCAGWMVFSASTFTGNYIKGTIQALWETSPLVQQPVTVTLVLLLSIALLLTARLKSTTQHLTGNQAKCTFTNYQDAELKFIPLILLAIFVYLYFIRSDSFFRDTFISNGAGKEIRSYREETFFRLSWFFSPVILWTGLLGTSLMVRRIKDSWQVAFYCCGLFSLLFFAYDIRCDPYQPYCMRRLATYANPLLLLGVVFGLNALLALIKKRSTSFLLVPLLIAVSAIFLINDSRIHQEPEMDGFLDELVVLSQELPDDGPVLIPLRSQLSHFSAPLRFIFEKEVLNVNSDKRSETYVNAMQNYLSASRSPVYLLTTSPVDLLGFPITDAEQIADGFFKIKYPLKNYETPFQRNKEVTIHYYLFKLSDPHSSQASNIDRSPDIRAI